MARRCSSARPCRGSILSLFYTRPDRSAHLGAFPEPELRQVEIGGAPEYMRPLRLLFVSDVHVRRWVRSERLEALIDRIAEIGADVLLLGGDYAESPRDMRRFFDALKRVSHPLGAYAVLGNNDIGSVDELRGIAAAANVEILCNETRRISLDGGTLEIGGCDEYRNGHPQTRGLFSDDGAYRILLSHFPAPPECECELMLSGHTHGGQVNLLGLTPYSLGFEHRYHLMAVRGLRQIGSMQLFVGTGIGVSRFPLRLGATPQIYLLKFGDK